MVRRFFIVFMLLCLPLRLWAGVGMVMDMAAPSAPAVQAQAADPHAAPCHEEGHSQHEVQTGAEQPCDSGQCATCLACHMPAMQVASHVLQAQMLPRAWVGVYASALYTAETGKLFKPPVF